MAPEPSKRFDVLLTFALRDRPAADSLANVLSSSFLTTLTTPLPADQQSVRPWLESLELSHTCALLLGASAAALPTKSSTWPVWSLLQKWVKNGQGNLVPVRVPGFREELLDPPAWVRELLWVDLRDGLDKEQHLRSLVEAVRGAAPEEVSRPGPQAQAGVAAAHTRRTLAVELERDHFSPHAWEAVRRAESFRTSHVRPALRLEHLLVGLFDATDSQAHKILSDAGISRSGLITLLRRVRADVPLEQPYPPAPVTGAVPPLTSETLEAIAAAARHAGTSSSFYDLYMQSEDVLAGLLSLQKHRLVRMLLKTSDNLEHIARSQLASVETVQQVNVSSAVAQEAPVLPMIPEESIHLASAHDQPTAEDSLGFQPYVDAIAEFLASADTKPPLTLSIEGEWGSGKSSFMLMLETALRERVPQPWLWAGKLPLRLWRDFKADREGDGAGALARLRRCFHYPSCLTVRFNAWRHDKEEALWAAFALEFLRRIRRQRRWPRRWAGDFLLFFRRYRWQELEAWLQLLRWIGARLALVLLVVGVPLAAFLLRDPWWAAVSTRIGALGKTEVSVLAWLAGLGAGGAYFAGVVTLALKVKDLVGNPLEADLRRHLRAPDYEDRVPFVERFHEDFRRIVSAYAGGRRKVFVFIDDLDRCEVPRAADLMQALNLLIADDPSLVFIIGMDREKVAAGLAVKYETLLPYLYAEGLSAVLRDAAREDGKVPAGTLEVATRRFGLEYGYTFLEKFVQLPFRVPVPQQADLGRFLATFQSAAGAKARRRTAGVNAPGLLVAAGMTVPVSDGRDGDSGPGRGKTPAGSEAGSSENGRPVEPALAAVRVPAAPPQVAPPAAPSPSAVSPAAQAARKQLVALHLGADSAAVCRVSLMVAAALENNPRRLKQFVNLFRLKAYIANETGLFDAVEGGAPPLTFEQLAKFVAIGLAWPALLTDLDDHSDLLALLEQRARGTDGLPVPSRAEERWIGRRRLNALLIHGCEEMDRFFPEPVRLRYSLTRVDMDKLLRISPRVARLAPLPAGVAAPEPVSAASEQLPASSRVQGERSQALGTLGQRLPAQPGETGASAPRTASPPVSRPLDSGKLGSEAAVVSAGGSLSPGRWPDVEDPVARGVSKRARSMAKRRPATSKSK